MGMGWGPSQVLLLERQSGRDRMTGRWGFTLHPEKPCSCLLYTSDAADDWLVV